MLKIFVCEDDQQQQQKLVETIEQYLYMQDLDAAFEFATPDPQKMLDYVSKLEGQPALYFLDVELKAEMNGIALGAAIREIDPNAKIVFITTHAELAYLTFLYKVEAMDYLAKDDKVHLHNRITECIDVAIERHLNGNKSSNDFIVIKSGGTQIRLELAEIQFIESSTTPHRLIIHLDNRQIEFYGKIKEIAELNPNFYRCHQSFVVNVLNIETINPKQREIQMKNGEICYASVRYLRGLILKFQNKK